MLRVIIILDLAFLPESLDALEVSENLAELPFCVPTLELAGKIPISGNDYGAKKKRLLKVRRASCPPSRES